MGFLRLDFEDKDSDRVLFADNLLRNFVIAFESLVLSPRRHCCRLVGRDGNLLTVIIELKRGAIIRRDSLMQPRFNTSYIVV